MRELTIQEFDLVSGAGDTGPSYTNQVAGAVAGGVVGQGASILWLISIQRTLVHDNHHSSLLF
ncbi:hypothetical protein [Xenorhabdus eapokensis]|uniref:Uncharacterized protein n=1 Tax=Xenorhabdus eapokensis TaxID=1873482 RepID=A0A1Q5TED9_9GAMM|nr:hypothetical protein [Xenorhabdus eapokensis]OKO98581.1 hypothetical protein Xedl_03838 [Xenorhabdus eapokensis]